MNSGRMLALPATMALAIAGTSPAKAEIQFTSDDGKFEVELGGRLQVDAAWYDEDNVNLDGENGTEIRRARLFVEGKMYDVWGYKAQYDFAGNEANIKDAYISYSGFESAKIKLGQFKQPSSLEELTSSK